MNYEVSNYNCQLNLATNKAQMDSPKQDTRALAKLGKVRKGMNVILLLIKGFVATFDIYNSRVLLLAWFIT